MLNESTALLEANKLARKLLGKYLGLNLFAVGRKGRKAGPLYPLPST